MRNIYLFMFLAILLVSTCSAESWWDKAGSWVKDKAQEAGSAIKDKANQAKEWAKEKLCTEPGKSCTSKFHVDCCRGKCVAGTCVGLPSR